jgi:asparagine synthase (glutamine-hydrolysing)
LAAELGTQLRTVTLAFDEYAGTQDDEAPLAEAYARQLRSDHATVRIGRDEFQHLVDEFLRSMDQPTVDGLNTYLVSRATASQGLKVALSGLGGDELFGGYPSFRQIPRLVKWGQFIARPKSLRRAVRVAFRMLALTGIPPKAAGLLAYSGDVAHAYLLRRALYLEDELDALLDESWLNEGLERLSTVAAITGTLSALSTAGATPHAQVAALESSWYMRNQLLRDTDWSSMAHGLEVRVPFVDTCLLERLGPAIASSVPPTKQDLAGCATQLHPEIHRRPKTGFNTPVREWIGNKADASERGLRGWADTVHQVFRMTPQPSPAQLSSMAAE